MKIRSALLVLTLFVTPAIAQQAVQQSGSVTRGHVPYWVTSGVVGDGGSATNSPISSIGVTNNGGAGICVSSDVQTAAGRNQLCFGASTTGSATISLQNYGTAAAQSLSFIVNGAAQGFPTVSPLPVVVGDSACFTTVGGGLKDCGTPGGTAAFANPTATTGLSVVNGSALTAMRSDASSPLSGTVQSALTGTNNVPLFGTGAFGFNARAIAYTDLPTIGANTVLGSVAGGTPAALTQTQLTALINTFTSGLSGAVPASGGGTTNFLRADGTFTAPAGGTFTLPITPQVRVTLASGVQVMTSSQAAANTVFVTPYGGCIIPIWNGSNFVSTCFAEVSQLTTDATKSPAAVANTSIYDIFCWIDTGPTNRCTRGPPWTNDTTRSAGTALLLNQGIWTNNATITNGPAAGFGTYIGSIRSDGSALINFTYGGFAAACTGANFAVFNAYNRVPVSTMLGINSASWTYAVANTWREINGSTSCVVLQLRGLNEDPIYIKYYATGVPGASTNMAAGIGIDSTTAFSGTTGFIGSGQATVQLVVGTYSGVPGLGYHTYAAIEFNTTTTASTWDGTAGVAYLQTGIHAELWQ